MKIIFSRPPRKKILIFDRNFPYLFIKTLKNKCEIMDVRKESINLFVLFYTLINNGLKNIKKNYIISYIKLVNPKIVLTFIDNNFFFYEIKKFYSKPKYISIQNGFRNHIFYKILKKKSLKNLIVDYCFVFGEINKRILSKFIIGKIIVFGNLKNNFIFKKKKNKYSKDIVFISQTTNSRDFFSREKIILKYLKEFCEKEDIKFKVYLADNNLENRYKNYEIIKKSNNDLPKKELENYNLFICCDSTLGYEMLSIKKKVVFLNLKKNIKLSNGKIVKGLPFGYPKKIKKDGFFWVNTNKKKLIFKTLKKVLMINKKKWNKIIRPYSKEFMVFNYNNIKLKKIIKKFL